MNRPACSKFGVFGECRHFVCRRRSATFRHARAHRTESAKNAIRSLRRFVDRAGLPTLRRLRPKATKTSKVSTPKVNRRPSNFSAGIISAVSHADELEVNRRSQGCRARLESLNANIASPPITIGKAPMIEQFSVRMRRNEDRRSVWLNALVMFLHEVLSPGALYGNKPTKISI